MSTKRRRILDEDDSDVDDESKNPSLTTTTSSSGNTTTTSDNKSANNEHNDDDEKAKNTVMRMLRNTKKSNVKVQLNKPSLPLPDSDDKKVGTVSIPRKASAQIPTTIPKRGRDEIPKKSKAIDDKDSNSTLLSLSMLPMPSSAVPQSQSQKPLTLSSVSGLSTGSTSVTGTTGTAAPSRPNTTPPPPPIAAAAAPQHRRRRRRCQSTNQWRQRAVPNHQRQRPDHPIIDWASSLQCAWTSSTLECHPDNYHRFNTNNSSPPPQCTTASSNPTER
ncbi:hypothetical protein MHU86_3994 [Fragilaria crotonensis]|nr:hypothetical protein MHU86_3994 [Fragilaria crotonensis]